MTVNASNNYLHGCLVGNPLQTLIIRCDVVCAVHRESLGGLWFYETWRSTSSSAVKQLHCVHTYMLMICKTNGRLQLCRYEMVKSYNCLVKINNETKSDMTYVEAWYNSGRVADCFYWPEIIKAGQDITILSYEKDYSLAGCSGYVTYKMFGTDITISFSNAVFESNKVGVGTGGKRVWDDMTTHDYSKFTVKIDSLQFDCRCTPSTTNMCEVKVTEFTK